MDIAQEFQGQLDAVSTQITELKAQIQQSEECARRLTEQRAELRSLQEQRDHLEKEKEKRILESKLERQSKDLAEINRMSRALRQKFNELKTVNDRLEASNAELRARLDAVEAAGSTGGTTA